MSVRADKHQRMLAELLTRPGNDVCADCRERAPRWSSWNIGIFVCVHCASIHRKMGTHISKVKSVTLDTWTKDQVESVKNMGNLKANAIYNPDQRRHPPPTDYDESDRDSEMEKYIRNKYQYKKYLAIDGTGAPTSAASITPQFAPVCSPSPPLPVPRPPAKDPVPGRVGGMSLGESSEFDKVIRAPSRAKSTPIVSPSASNGGRTNVLSSASPAIPSIPSSSTSRAPVFEPTLPFRPSTAAALEAPYASASSSSNSAWPSSSSYRNSNTSSAPPVPPVTYPMRPYSAASTSASTQSNVQQPPLQYLSPSITTSAPNSNPMWDDLTALAGAGMSSMGSGLGSTASQLGSTAFTPGMGGNRPNIPSSNGTLPLPSSYGASLGSVAPRSFSLPLNQQSLSPVVTGASNYSTGSTTSSSGGGPNPFMGLNANSSALSLGSGSTGGMGMGGSVGSSMSSLNPYSSLSGLNTGSTGFTSSNGGSLSDTWSSQGQQNARQNILNGQNQFVSSPTSEQQLSQSFGGMNMGGASGGLGSGSQYGAASAGGSSPFQMSQPTGSSFNSMASSSMSFQQTYSLNPYANSASSATSSLSPSPLSFQSQPQNQQSSAPSQSSFAQSMLPSHLKNQGQQQSQNLNPFGNAGSWSQQQQFQQQQQQQQQQAGQQAFGNLFAAAYGNGSNGSNGWR